MTRVIALLLLGAAALPPANYDDLFPAWSPDGRAVVFTSTRDGDPEIYLADLGGGALRRLTSEPGRDAHPAFAPDGAQVAFQSPRRGGATQIYLMRRDGSDQWPITDNRGFCGMPVWSPDGRRLAFQCSDDPTRPGRAEVPWRIFVMEAAGGRPEQLTHGPGNDQVANWAPDGRLIFHSDRTGTDQLYLLDPELQQVAPLTAPPGSHRSASFAPDGRLIAFLSDRAGAPADVHVMRLDGSERRQLTTSGPEHGLPLFSPDGTRLLFQHRQDGQSRIWVVGVDGRGAAPLFR